MIKQLNYTISKVFSSGGRYAFTAKKGKKYVVVVDNQKQESEKYDKIEKFKFSPDGKSFAFIAEKGDDYFIVKDGKEIGKYYLIKDFTFSKDGKKLTYIVEKEDGKEMLIEEGEEKEVLMKDKKEVVKKVKKDGKYMIVKDGKESKMYENIKHFEISPDGKSFIFVGEEGKTDILVKDFEKIAEYDIIDTFNSMYLPNGKGYAFIAQKGEKHFLVKNGKKIAGYDYISCLTFSPYGECYFVGSENGKYIVVKDKKEIAKYDNEVWNLKISPNGESYAIQIKGDDGDYIIKDGKEIKDGDKILLFDYIPYWGYTTNGNFVIIGQKDGIFYLVQE